MDTSDIPSVAAANDAAALWYAKLDAGIADVDAFEAWRSADPMNAVAYARIAATDDAISRMQHFPREGDPELTLKPRLSRRTVIGLATLVPIVGAATWLATTARAHASTTVGQRKRFKLPDGGTVELNTNSKVSWRYDANSRHFWLERGEIALTVPPDDRPMSLMGGGALVTTVSGDLNARLKPAGLDVSVSKGTCVVSAKKNLAQPIQVTAGEGALSADGLTTLRSMTVEDLRLTTAWQKDELIFSGEPLSAAVDEYNRYVTDKIVIADPAVGAIRIGGRFSTHDPKGFVLALKSSFGIQARTGESGTILLSR